MQMMKISEFIKVLEGYKKDLGDLPVIHSSDPEGNSFGTVTANSCSYMDSKIGQVFVIAPFDENIDDELY